MPATPAPHGVENPPTLPWPGPRVEHAGRGDRGEAVATGSRAVVAGHVDDHVGRCRLALKTLTLPPVPSFTVTALGTIWPALKLRLEPKIGWVEPVGQSCRKEPAVGLDHRHVQHDRIGVQRHAGQTADLHVTDAGRTGLHGVENAPTLVAPGRESSTRPGTSGWKSVPVVLPVGVTAVDAERGGAVADGVVGLDRERVGGAVGEAGDRAAERTGRPRAGLGPRRRGGDVAGDGGAAVAGRRGPRDRRLRVAG